MNSPTAPRLGSSRATSTFTPESPTRRAFRPWVLIPPDPARVHPLKERRPLSWLILTIGIVSLTVFYSGAVGMTTGRTGSVIKTASAGPAAYEWQGYHRVCPRAR